MKEDPIIDALRLRTHDAEHTLLGDHAVCTTLETHDFAGSSSTRAPLTIASFGGRRHGLSVFQASMFVTGLTTAFFLFSLPHSIDPREIPSIDPQLQQTLSIDTSDTPSEELHTAAPEEGEDFVPEPDVIPPSPRFARFDNKQGIFLTASTVSRTDAFNEKLDALIAAGGSTIVMDVKGGGVLFRSAAPAAQEIGIVRSLYDLPEILRVLHEKNIYVIGRFVAIKDEAYTFKKPETRIKDPKTGAVLTSTWIDPAHDEAIEYNMQVVCELAAAGIDEINLDYIRFSTAEFGALLAYSGQEKADRLEKFIKATRETIDRCGPTTRLGLSTYAILGWNYPQNVETLGQDVVRFAPLVDVISPMAYPSTFTSPSYYNPGVDLGPRMYWLVYRTLTGYTELLGEEHRHKIRPWIQGYFVDTADVAHQIRAVYDAGFCGYTVWNASNTYAQTLAAMKNDTLKPVRCLDVVPSMQYVI